jgi:hypothetical protein
LLEEPWQCGQGSSFRHGSAELKILYTFCCAAAKPQSNKRKFVEEGDMPHPLVLQLRFARSELLRALAGLTDEEARRRFMPMNCISWNIGHLAWQEQRYWLWRGQNQVLLPQLNEQFANGAPACSLPLDEVWGAWRTITQAADPWLDQLTTAQLQQPREFTLPGGEAISLTMGSLMLRTTYHYWYHIGESMAIRQLLGHTGLPDFVGNIDDEAPYLPH